MEECLSTVYYLFRSCYNRLHLPFGRNLFICLRPMKSVLAAMKKQLMMQSQKDICQLDQREQFNKEASV